MSEVLVCASVWVIAGPTLIFLIWQTQGRVFGLPVLLVFLSITRHPLNYFRRRFMSLPIKLPPEVARQLYPGETQSSP